MRPAETRTAPAIRRSREPKRAQVEQAQARTQSKRTQALTRAVRARAVRTEAAASSGGAASSGAGSGNSPASAGASGSTSSSSGVRRIFYLDVQGRVLTFDEDKPTPRTLVSSAGQGPDGIAVDVAGGHLFWTTMGVPADNDGSLRRSDLDGSKVTTVVPTGGSFTPKQLKLDLAGERLYWSDREGMRIQRAANGRFPSGDAGHGSDRRQRAEGRRELVRRAGARPRSRLHLLDPKRTRRRRAAPAVASGRANLDGSGARDLVTGSGALTGIAVVQPAP